MAESAAHREEERRFLDDMEAVLGDAGMVRLAAVRDAMQLDYGGVDFGRDRDGRIIAFEANAAMAIYPRPTIRRGITGARPTRGRLRRCGRCCWIAPSRVVTRRHRGDERFEVRTESLRAADCRGVERLPHLERASGVNRAPRTLERETRVVPRQTAKRNDPPRFRLDVGDDGLVAHLEEPIRRKDRTPTRHQLVVGMIVAREFAEVVRERNVRAEEQCRKAREARVEPVTAHVDQPRIRSAMWMSGARLKFASVLSVIRGAAPAMSAVASR